MEHPVEFIKKAPLGTRMTVRKRIEGGFTDAVGYLRECNSTACVIETRHEVVTIALDEVTAAKAVSPARLGRPNEDRRVTVLVAKEPIT